ncbi:MAG: glycosyltransferase, partial [Acidobacteria bacterium]
MKAGPTLTGTPLVSVGMPVYNGARVLRRAIESVLTQTYRQVEVVICDNGSQDGTEAICRDYAERDTRIRYVRNEQNIGAIPNFRRVLQLSHGPYFMWTAADDCRPVNAVASCVEALERCPGAVMVHGPIHARLNSARSVEVLNRMDLSSSSVYERVRAFTRGLEHNGMLYGMYRRPLIDAASLREHFGHDYLFCLQACLLGPIAYTPSPIIIYQHRNGAVVGPMYAAERPKPKDLLLHRGVWRRKCWMTLLLGSCYLLVEPRAAISSRIEAVAAHISGFCTRYIRHLASESLFLLFTPAFWIAAPFSAVAVRAKAGFKRRR